METRALWITTRREYLFIIDERVRLFFTCLLRPISCRMLKATPAVRLLTLSRSGEGESAGSARGAVATGCYFKLCIRIVHTWLRRFAIVKQCIEKKRGPENAPGPGFVEVITLFTYIQ